MSTVNKEIIKRLIEDDGFFEDDPKVYCMVMYQNRLKYGEDGEIVYGLEEPGSCWDFAVYYDRRRYLMMYDSPVVGGVEILWGSDQFFEDEVIEMDICDVDLMLHNELDAVERDDALMEWTDKAKAVVRRKMVETAKNLFGEFPG